MQNFITKNTYQRLISQLEKIKNIEIPKISKEKLEAARQGDLSENAEYEAAKEKLEMLINRCRQMEERLENPVFIDDLNVPGTIVSIGTQVSVKEIDSGREESFTILGSEDSDVDKNIVSFQSPIAKALIGKKAGDHCEVVVPAGNKKVRIEGISKYKSFL
jgi:transcription elongation factor GreA